MAITWDNPMGHNIIVTRCCGGCECEDTRTLWTRPIEFAGSDACALTERRPLTIPEVASMLKDAPFECRECGSTRAKLVTISLDTSYIPF